MLSVKLPMHAMQAFYQLSDIQAAKRNTSFPSVSLFLSFVPRLGGDGAKGSGMPDKGSAIELCPFSSICSRWGSMVLSFPWTLDSNATPHFLLHQLFTRL